MNEPFDYYSLKQNYHLALETIYRDIAAAQTEKSNQYVVLSGQTPDNIDTLNALSSEHQALAEHHNDRQFLFLQQTHNGYSNSDSGLLNQYTDEGSLDELHLMVSDLYENRCSVYEAQSNVISNIYSPAQRLNHLLQTLNEHRNDTNLAQRYEAQCAVGQSTINAYRTLSQLYSDRAQQSRSQDAIDELQTERSNSQQHSFEAQAIEYQLNSELYTEMATPSYWETFYQELADQHIDTGLLYTQLADEHKEIADDNAELVEDAQNEADHTLLGFDGVILNDSYTWDAIGNLTERTHGAVDVTQTFEYDELNRLTRADLSGTGVELYDMLGMSTETIEYDAIGNITYKSNVGTYTYGNNSGPHAVTSITGDVNAGQKSANYTYDANGNMTAGDGRNLIYASHNKPTEITKGSNITQFTYGPERQLVKQTDTTDTGVRTTLHFGSYEKITQGGEVTHKYHIGGPAGGTIAVLIDKGDEVPKTHYLHRDHLDSIVAITDDRGFIVERFHYDAFGNRRTAVGVQSESFLNTLNLDITDRGFTGHKFLSGVDLIHMKGRVYDATIGRFLSADPHIQFVGHTQSYNRYSYVLNNPLAYTDPSGYFLSFVFSLVKVFALIAKTLAVIAAIIKAVEFILENLRVVLAVVAAIAIIAFAPVVLGAIGLGGSAFIGASGLTFLGSVTAGAIAGGVSGLISTGSLKGMLKGAVMGALTGAIGHGFKAGNFLDKAFKGAKKIGQVVTHGIAGGIRADWNGGSFSKGFVTGAVGKFFSNSIQGLENANDYVKGLLTATAGGITSKLVGGSFEAGFLLAGVAYAVNNMASSIKNSNQRRTKLTKNGDKVHIKLRIKFDGPGATSENIARFQAGIQKYWTGTFGRFSVSTEVEVVNSGRYHLIDVRDFNGVSNMNGQNGYDGHWLSSSSGWTAAHEMGHAMGGVALPDQYEYITRPGGILQPVSKPGFENNIMGANEGSYPSGDDIEKLIIIHDY